MDKTFATKPASPKANKIASELRSIQQKRIQHDAFVQESTHFVLPRKSDMREIQSIGSFNGGELKSYANLFTRAARSSNQKMASGIFSYMTPKNQKWFKITTGDRELDENDEVYKYFDSVRDTMLDLLARSNFTEISHETYLNFGSIGTVCSQVEWDKDEDGLMLTDYPYNTFWFTEDNKGRPNRIFREFVWTAEQAVDEWSEEELKDCASVMKAYYSKDEDARREQFKFIHLVEPNKHRKHDKIDKSNKKYKSTFICDNDKQIIREGGFDTLPYKIARFLKYNTEGQVMGYSPAMDCMPIIKTLENLKKKFIFAVEKNLNPAMSRGVSIGQVPNKVRSSPNAINNFDSRNPESKPTPILQQIDLSYSLAELEEEVKQIEDAFFIPSFQTITNIDKSNVTATEILAREREALAAISPAISRIEDEWLEPILEDIFKIANKRGLLPEPPQELEGGVIRLEFTGILSSAPKLTESVSVMNYFQELGVMLEFMPENKRIETMSSLDFYEINKTLQENRNLPARFRFSREEMEEEAAKIQQQQQQAQEQEMLANVAKQQNLNQAPEEGSPMEGVMG